MKNYRIVIVGGGILGASVAFNLARFGESDVVVLEAERELNLHSTGRSAAYYIPMYDSQAYANLAKASLEFLKDPPDGFSTRPIFFQDGAVIAAIEGFAKGVIDEMAEAKALGIDVTLIGGSQVVELVPVARPELVEAAAFYPDAGEIDVGLLASSYKAAAVRCGVSFQTGTTFLKPLVKGGKIKGAVTSRGEISCEHIVNAAGAWAGDVAKTMGVSVPTIVLRRHLMKAALPPVWSRNRWPFYRCPSLPLYYKQADGILAFSPMDAGRVDVPGDCPVDTALIEGTTKTLNENTTVAVHTGDVTAVAGYRVFAPDHGPLVGNDPVVPNFHWAAALGGSGIMAAPAVGDLVASEILERPITMDTSAISPRRFWSGTARSHK